MEEIEAQRTIIAHAACILADGCDLCPFYDAENSTTRQQAICQNAITNSRLREALITLRGSIE